MVYTETPPSEMSMTILTQIDVQALKAVITRCAGDRLELVTNGGGSYRPEDDTLIQNAKAVIDRSTTSALPKGWGSKVSADGRSMVLKSPYSTTEMIVAIDNPSQERRWLFGLFSDLLGLPNE